MANKPILFSAAMVAAILDGRKTQTRRVMKTQMPENFWREGGIDTAGEYAYAVPLAEEEKDDHLVHECKFPYGNIGDTLWVREEHYRVGHWEKCGKTKTGKQKWKFVADISGDVRYSDNPPSDFMVSRSKEYPDVNLWYKRLARFMPRSLSRIRLEITDIRVERLKDISQSDALSEGSYLGKCDCFPKPRTPIEAMVSQTWCHVHGQEFKNLWKSINGADSWDENPWVWVISFKVSDVKQEGRRTAACRTERQKRSKEKKCLQS